MALLGIVLPTSQVVIVHHFSTPEALTTGLILARMIWVRQDGMNNTHTNWIGGSERMNRKPLRIVF